MKRGAELRKVVAALSCFFRISSVAEVAAAAADDDDDLAEDRLLGWDRDLLLERLPPFLVGVATARFLADRVRPATTSLCSDDSSS